MLKKRMLIVSLVVLFILQASICIVSADIPTNYFNWVKNTETSKSNSLNCVRWLGNQFIAVGSNGTILTSPDGNTWIERESWETSNFNHVVQKGSCTIVSPSSGNYILISYDTINWTKIFPGMNYIKGVETNGNIFVAYGASGEISTSSNGTDWTQRYSGINVSINDMFWDGHNFFAVGPSETIITSTDGINWQRIEHYDIATLSGITKSNDKYVAVGTYGCIDVSSNGKEWTRYLTGNNDDLRDIIWDGTQFITVGHYGAMRMSTDAINWAFFMTDYSYHYNSIAFNGSKYVVVGNHGLILTSNVYKVNVNGSLLNLPTPPAYKNGRLLLPLRDFTTALGGRVDWDNATRTAICEYNGTVIRMQIDNKNVSVNGNNTTVDVPATIINDKTMVPVRFIAEKFGYFVNYDANSKTALISK